MAIRLISLETMDMKSQGSKAGLNFRTQILFKVFIGKPVFTLGLKALQNSLRESRAALW